MTCKALYHVLIWTINPNSPNIWRLILWERCKNESLDLHTDRIPISKLQIKGTICTNVLDATQYKIIYQSRISYRYQNLNMKSNSDTI